MKILEILDGKTIALILIVFAIVLVEIILRMSKKKIGSDYDSKKLNVSKFSELESETIKFYRRNQTLDVVRVISAIVGLGLIILVFNIQAFSILAIATGALIIILKEEIISFLSYFYVISVFDVGDDLVVANITGEVVRFKPFYVALAGKDETGQYDGKLHYIPNYKFMIEHVVEQEVKTTTVRRIDLVALYNHTTFPDNFTEWKEKVKNFLDNTLPKQTLKDVGNFKSFAGIKYQIRFNYNDKGEVLAKISFVARPPKTSEHKEKIISYIESIRKPE